MFRKRGFFSVGLIVTILVLFLGGCQSTERVNLTSFASISFSGYDGKAMASLNIDWGALEEAVLADNEINTLASLSKITEIEDSIHYSLDKTEGLSNGDIVNLQINWNDDIAKKYNLSFHAEPLSVSVSGLELLEEIDLFVDIFIEYDGIAPEAYAILRNASTNAYLKTIQYSVENPFDLRNGDTIVVIAHTTHEAAESRGYTFQNAQKSFIVDGIDEYIKSYSLIDEETFEKLDKQARDVISTALAKRDLSLQRLLYPSTANTLWVDIIKNSFQLIEVNLKCSYFFVLKDGMTKTYNDVNNSIFIIYEVKFTSDNTDENNEYDIVYISVFYKDFIKRDRGNIDVRVTDASIRSSYDSYDNLFREVVESNKARYDYEEIVY